MPALESASPSQLPPPGSPAAVQSCCTCETPQFEPIIYEADCPFHILVDPPKPRARKKPVIAPFDLTPLNLARMAVHELHKGEIRDTSVATGQRLLERQKREEQVMERVMRRVLTLVRSQPPPTA